VQKQASQQQQIEAELALKELATATNAYKIVGSVMVSAPVESLRQELEKKRESATARISLLEKQEEKLRAKLHGHNN
jgi:chaperonin cofactor prefoldin